MRMKTLQQELQEAREKLAAQFGLPCSGCQMVFIGLPSTEPWACDKCLAAQAEASVDDMELQEAIKERDQLREWKESALEQLNAIPLQEIGKAIGVQWGDSISDKILPWITEANARLEASEAESKWYREELKIAHTTLCLHLCRMVKGKLQHAPSCLKIKEALNPKEQA